VTVFVVAPPGPVQARVKSVRAVIAAVVAGPFVGWLPDHPPEAVHVSAFCVDQLRVTVLPEATLEALLCRSRVGAAAAGPTSTVIAYVPASSGKLEEPGFGCAMKLT
jgi:hypothetical protein